MNRSGGITQQGQAAPTLRARSVADTSLRRAADGIGRADRGLRHRWDRTLPSSAAAQMVVRTVRSSGVSTVCRPAAVTLAVLLCAGGLGFAPAAATTDECSANTATTCTAAVGDSATESIDVTDNRDWFGRELRADKSCRIDLEGSATGAGTLYEP